MDEDRLREICKAQEREIKRLRAMLSKVRTVRVEFYVEGDSLCIVGTAIGIDEFHFIEQVRPELARIAEEISDAKVENALANAKVTDGITGDEIEGAINPQPGDCK